MVPSPVDRGLRDAVIEAIEKSIEALGIPALPADCRMAAPAEVACLEAAGCSCRDWARVLVKDGAVLESIQGCRFEGDVVLALARGSSLLSSTLADCVLDGRITVARTSLLEGYHVLDGARIEDCGRIVFDDSRVLSRGPRLDLGVETGERSIRAIPAMTVKLASNLTSGSATARDVDDYETARSGFESFLGSLESGVIGAGSVLLSAPLVSNCLVGEGCTLDCPGSLRDSILLGGAGEGCLVRDGSIVRSSIVQWSAEIDGCAIVENSLVCECARVEKGAKLSSSLLGPCSEQGSGEVSSSLVGPLCAMHHQSLLIAARWPFGCGNIGYGANVGSNHTSRLPDQEIFIGTGVFFGLGTSVKFPAFISTGTVIATGVVLPPGRIGYPFSLVTQDERRESPSSCSLAPGWVLYANLFAFLRNQMKLRARFRAKRGSMPECFTGFETALQVHRARRILESVPVESPFYTSTELPGAGPCSVAEESRLKGIEGYTLYLRWLGLSALFPVLEKGAAMPAPGAFENAGDRAALAFMEYPGESPRDLMKHYVELLGEMRTSVVESRTRDFRRGSAVIPDYSMVHAHPDKDDVLLALLGDIDAESKKVAGWIKKAR